MFRRLCLVTFLSVLLLALVAGPVLADTWYVDASGGSDLNDGTTPASAFKSVTKGVATAVSGDVVSVLEGLYAGPVTGEVFPIAMKSGVLLQGSGASGTTIMGNGSVAVISAVGVDAAATVDGFTIREGHPGIFASYSAMTVSNNTITANTGDYAGAGIHTDNGSLVISSNTITDNHAVYGGGISCEEYDTSTIVGNDITGNTASGGGGICAYYHADPTIEGNTIAGNAADLGGGLLAEAASLPSVARTVFSGNTAAGPGGGLMGYSASALVENCVFSGNDAGADGGAVALMNSGATEIVNCTLADNTSGAGAAGIARYSTSWPASALITNCILWHNDNAGTTGWDDVDAVFEATYSDLSDREGDPLLHTISDDPLFADAAGEDYRLTEGSPCIDAADDAAAPATDLDGLERPQGDAADMGAYEFAGTPVDTTPPTIAITSPQDGAAYISRDGTVFAFDAQDESGIASLVATLGDGTAVESGDELPVKPGAYVLTVTAVDNAGNPATAQVSFTVIVRGQGGGPKSGAYTATGVVD